MQLISLSKISLFLSGCWISKEEASARQIPNLISFLSYLNGTQSNQTHTAGAIAGDKLKRR